MEMGTISIMESVATYYFKADYTPFMRAVMYNDVVELHSRATAASPVEKIFLQMVLDRDDTRIDAQYDGVVVNAGEIPSIDVKNLDTIFERNPNLLKFKPSFIDFMEKDNHIPEFNNNLWYLPNLITNNATTDVGKEASSPVWVRC